ncbi:MAG: hypothetical protein WD532_02995 [Acidimicrobiia bacterium]
MTETAGLLVCDHVAPEFLDLHSDMFGRLLGPEGFELKVFEVIAGELPDPVERCDAWTVTSSRYSVYDDEVLAHWIAAFLRQGPA